MRVRGRSRRPTPALQCGMTDTNCDSDDLFKEPTDEVMKPMIQYRFKKEIRNSRRPTRRRRSKTTKRLTIRTEILKLFLPGAPMCFENILTVPEISVVNKTIAVI